jgi:WD40 repeat protein
MNRVVALFASLLAAGAGSAADPSFRADVAPLLVGRCVSCHSGQKPKGGYKAHTFDALLAPGKTGETPVVPGKPDESELLRRLVDTDPAVRMPPDDSPLSPSEIDAVRKWIAAGAGFDGPDKTAALTTYLAPRKHPSAPAVYPAPVPVFALAFAPGGKELVVGGVHEATIWDAATGKLIRRIPDLPARIHALAFSPDGSKLLIGGGSPGEYGEATVLDPADPAKRTVLGVFPDVVLAGAFSADGKTAVAGSADRSCRAFRTADGGELWRASFHSDWVTAAAVSPDGRYVATASKDRTVKVLEATTGKLFTTYNGHRRQFGQHVGQFEVYGVGFDDANVAYSAGAGAAVRV